jgi:hypothetical protein
MTKKSLAVLCGFGAMVAALPLRAASESKQLFSVTSTQYVDFQPGGLVHLNDSYGYLTVEGWDERQVGITVTKSFDRPCDPEEQELAEKTFGQIRVVTERHSDKDLSIATVLPDRHGFPFSILPSRQIVFTMPKKTSLGVKVEYTVHVPRDSRLVVHQDNGYVWVSDVTGDLEVHSHTGDMIVMLADPGPYSIDAWTAMGTVSSDVAGNGRKRYLLATQFLHDAPASARRVYLRMGRGNITIKSGPASGPFWKN